MSIQTYNDPKNPTEHELMHVPVIEPQGELKVGEPVEVRVTVGKEPHPMTPEHHIEWIELWIEDKLFEKTVLMPDQEIPKADYTVTLEKGDSKFQAVASCNLHGLWELTMEI